MPSVVKIYKLASGQNQPQGRYDPKARQTTYGLTRTYRVQFDAQDPDNDLRCFTATDGATAIPLLGTVYPDFSPALTCIRVTPKSIDAPGVYEVEVEWASATKNQQAGKWNFSISIDGVQITEDTWEDSIGAAILNTAGQPYDPSVSRTHYDEKITVTYDCDADTIADVMSAIQTCRGKVCDGNVTMDDFNGLSIQATHRQLKLANGGCSWQYTQGNDIGYWSVKLELELRQDRDLPDGQTIEGYTSAIMDRGLMEISPAGGTNLRNITVSGQDVTSPVNLDKDGHKLNPGDKPHWSTFKIEEEADFTNLFAGLAD